MRMRGSDILLGVVGIGAGYALYKFFNSTFWKNLTFNASDLGPKISQTAEVISSIADYVKRGYMAYDANNNTYITPLGNKFVARAKELYEGYLSQNMPDQEAYILARKQADTEVSNLSGYEKTVYGERVI